MKNMVWILLGLIFLYVVFEIGHSYYYLSKGRELSKKVYVGSVKVGDVGNQTLKVLVRGDSVGAGVGATSWETSTVGRLATYLAEKYSVNLVNESVSGSRMSDMLKKDLPEKQDLIVLIVSSNDFFHLTPIKEFEESTKEVLEKYSFLTKKLIIVGPGRIFDSSAIPIPLRLFYALRAESYGVIVAKEAKKYDNVVHVNPLHPSVDPSSYKNISAADLFHPNDEGHRFWSDLIKPALK